MGNGVFAKQNMKKDQILFELTQEPISPTIIIDDQVALFDFFQKEMHVEDRVFTHLEDLNYDQPTNFMAFFVMSLFIRNDNTSLFPFVQSLPYLVPPHLSFMYEENKLSELVGSPLYQFSIQRKHAIHHFYTNRVEPLAKQVFKLEEDQKYISLGLFETALAIVWSRTHSVLRSQHERRSALVPLGDLINFSFEPNVVSFTDSNSNRFVYRAIRDIQAGEQLFVEYSNHVSNIQLMMDYGFCIMSNDRHNLNDIIFLDVAPLVTQHLYTTGSTDLSAIKESILRRMNLYGQPTLIRISAKQIQTFGQNGHLSSLIDVTVLSMLRVVLMDKVEALGLSQGYNEADTTAPSMSLLTEISKRNEQLLRHSIKQLIDAAIRHYKTTISEDQALLASKERLDSIMQCIVWIRHREKVLLHQLKSLL